MEWDRESITKLLFDQAIRDGGGRQRDEFVLKLMGCVLFTDFGKLNSFFGAIEEMNS